MGTDKIVVKETDQFMADYKPIYKPIYPLLTGKQYTEEVGKINFKRIEAVGDLDSKLVFPKDTEIHRFSSLESEKSFKKFFRAGQYVQSGLQSQEGAQTVVNQVLDRANIQYDSLLLTGEGTEDANVVNNALFWSGDPNHTTKSSEEIATENRLYEFHKYIMARAEEANQIDGRKLIMFYGNTIERVNALFTDGTVPFVRALQDSLGGNYNVAKMPTASTPASAHGFMIINLDQVVVHYIKHPQLDSSGYDARLKEYWWNFYFGSTMAEILVKDALIKCPITWAA